MTLRSLLASVALLVVASPAHAADGPALGRLAAFDASFGFVEPGRTTVPDALKRLGAPAIDYAAWVAKEKIDWEIEAPTPRSLSALPKDREEVRVLEWHDAHDDTRRAAKLVFRSDVLWYALLPFSPSESTPAKAEARWGAKPAMLSQTRVDGDVQHTVTVYGYPEQGVGYVLDDFDGSGEFRAKALFPPRRR